MKLLISIILLFVLVSTVEGKTKNEYDSLVKYNTYPALSYMQEAEINTTLFYHILYKPVDFMTPVSIEAEKMMEYLSYRIYYLELKHKFTYRFRPTNYFEPVPIDKRKLK